MSPKKILEDIVQSLAEDSTSYAIRRSGLWNSNGAGTAQKMTHGQYVQNLVLLEIEFNRGLE